MYQELLEKKEYLEIVNRIEQFRFITDGKWDWEHGLGHFQRVALYVQKILTDLQVEKRIVEIGMVTALLHDVGLVKGMKENHAFESSQMTDSLIEDFALSDSEREMMRQAITDHSKGENICSPIGLALVLADKLDITYHRTENSSIQDRVNREIQKIREVSIEIDVQELRVRYRTVEDFDVNVLVEWSKAITIPEKVARFLNKKFLFFINDQPVDVSLLVDFL